MYEYRRTVITKNKSIKYQLFRGREPLVYSDFISLLQQKEAFRSFFIELLSNIPLRAYHWETPPVTRSTTDQPFEFVVTETTEIDLPPDPGPFHRYFRDKKGVAGVAVFDNLGGDARLVAPYPVEGNLNYSHIGVFTDEAPLEHQHSLWQEVGRVTQTQVSGQPLWLNTAGGGVAWLHVRLDSRPKYYRHLPYT